MLFKIFFTATMFNISPSGPVQGAMVGSPQMIQCTVNTVGGVEFSSVMISWMGPGGDTITSDSRVTINPTSPSGNTYTSSIQFIYLMEGDEGTYICNVTSSSEFSGSESVEINNLTSNHYMQLCALATIQAMDLPKYNVKCLFRLDS